MARILLLRIMLTVTNTGGGSPATTDVFSATTTFTNSTMASATGDFGQFDIGLNPDNVDIEILDNQQDGDYYRPRLTITIENSIGAEIGGSINSLEATSDGQVPIPVTINIIQTLSN